MTVATRSNLRFEGALSQFDEKKGPLILPYGELYPRIHPDAWIASTAVIAGDVVIGEQSSIWFGTVIRGDLEKVRVGAGTNIQDLSVVHVDSGGFSVEIGDDVTIGHAAKIHGCTVRDEALIGIGATVLNGAEIGAGAMVAAGSLVPPGMQVPEGVLVMGSPAKVVRTLSEEARREMFEGVRHYVECAQIYKRGEQRGS